MKYILIRKDSADDPFEPWRPVQFYKTLKAARSEMLVPSVPFVRGNLFAVIDSAGVSDISSHAKGISIAVDGARVLQTADNVCKYDWFRAYETVGAETIFEMAYPQWDTARIVRVGIEILCRTIELNPLLQKCRATVDAMRKYSHRTKGSLSVAATIKQKIDGTQDENNQVGYFRVAMLQIFYVMTELEDLREKRNHLYTCLRSCYESVDRDAPIREEFTALMRSMVPLSEILTSNAAGTLIHLRDPQS